MSFVAPAKVTPNQDHNPLVLHRQPRFPQALPPLPTTTSKHQLTADPSKHQLTALLILVEETVTSSCQPWAAPASLGSRGVR